MILSFVLLFGMVPDLGIRAQAGDAEEEPAVAAEAAAEAEEEDAVAEVDVAEDDEAAEAEEDVPGDPDGYAYRLYVGNTQVSDTNKDDILGDGKGLVQYDPDSATLTLKEGATITELNTDKKALIWAAEDLNICLEGAAVVSNTDASVKYGILLTADENTESVLAIGGTGSLSVEVSNDAMCGIRADGIVIADTVQDLWVSGAYFALYYDKCGYVQKGGDVVAAGKGSGIHGGSDLTLDGGTLSVTVTAFPTDTSVGAWIDDGMLIIRSKFGADGQRAAAYAKQGIVISDDYRMNPSVGVEGTYFPSIGDYDATAENPYKCFMEKAGQPALVVDIEPYKEGETAYDVWVGGIRVNSLNKDKLPGISDGSAYYNPDTNTLNLNDVKGFFHSKSWGVKTFTYNAFIWSKGSLNLRGSVDTAIDPDGSTHKYLYYMSEEGTSELDLTAKVTSPDDVFSAKRALSISQVVNIPSSAGAARIPVRVSVRRM